MVIYSHLISERTIEKVTGLKISQVVTSAYNIGSTHYRLVGSDQESSKISQMVSAVDLALPTYDQICYRWHRPACLGIGLFTQHYSEKHYV